MKELIIVEDRQIVALYFSRDEQAIARTAEKYGAYCGSIAGNILQNEQDTEECLNDTWLSAWNSIPPKRPENLAAYLGKITRLHAIDRWRALHARKRGGDSVTLALEELEEVLPSGNNPEQAALTEELSRTIHEFLSSLPTTERNLFLCRYWYFDGIAAISKNFGFRENTTKTKLYRIRRKLQRFLQKEGLL